MLNDETWNIFWQRTIIVLDDHFASILLLLLRLLLVSLYSCYFFSSNRLNKYKTDHDLFFSKISPINLRCAIYLLVMHHWIEILWKISEKKKKIEPIPFKFNWNSKQKISNKYRVFNTFNSINDVFLFANIQACSMIRPW